MKNIVHKLGTAAFLSAALLLTACEPEIEDDTVFTRGSQLDLTKFVAVGNSLTAGFQDNGLTLAGQVNSIPNILAFQFSYVGGGNFVQPVFPSDKYNGTGYLRLNGFTASGSPIISPLPLNDPNLAIVGLGADGKTPLLSRYTDLHAIQNFGVPGIKLADINTVGYGLNNPMGFNPYFERILPASSPMTYLQRIATSQPTFFSAWLGNNDVLGYATAGGFAGTITPTATFDALYTELIATMSANNTEGIVVTIPDVRSVPFFTTVGPSAKPLLAGAVAAANAQGSPITGVSVLTKNTAQRINVTPASIKNADGGTILFTLTSSAYLPLIGKPTGQYWRELAASQNPSNPNAQLAGYLANFQIDTTKAFGLDPRNPIPSAFVLDDEEQKLVNDATKAYNVTIKAQAAAKNLAVFDSYTFFNSIQNGLSLNGVAYSPAFITGHLFSLDGVHLTPRGYAIVANEMIKEINRKYTATIPTINVTQFRSVLIP